MLVLRKCGPNGESAHGFRYGHTGDTVTAPDWDPTPRCGGGLHGLPGGDGDWNLLQGDDWLVIEAAEEDIVMIDDDKCKFRRGTILYRGDKEGLHQFVDRMAFTGRAAYFWANDIGDKEIMRERITEAEWAYYWATEIGDKEIMRDRVVESRWAYWWAKDIGDREIMRDRIIESEWAYYWASDIGDREIMRHRIRHEPWITRWRKTFGWDPV